MNEIFKRLEWDSEFFGFAVGQIIPAKLNPAELGACLEAMREAGIRLAYWPSGLSEPEAAAVEQAGGKLVDLKTTYHIRLEGHPPDHWSADPRVERYESKVAGTGLVDLAIQAGIYSRFHTDERIGYDKFETLYRKWIEQSVNGTIAREVLVTRDGAKITSMITLGEKNGTGNIGLIAVDASTRGAGLGKALIQTSLHRFAAQGYPEVTVVTQGFNEAACKLYEKCGFSVLSAERYFHFWL